MGSLSSVNSEASAAVLPAFHRIRAARRLGLQFVPRRPVSEPVLQRTGNHSKSDLVLIPVEEFAELHRLSERQVQNLLDSVGMRSICLDGRGYVVEPDTSEAVRRSARIAE